MYFFQQLKKYRTFNRGVFGQTARAPTICYLYAFSFFSIHKLYIFIFIFSGESIEEVNAELDNLDRKDNFLKQFSCNKIRFKNKSEAILKISLHTAFIVFPFRTLFNV